MSFVDDVWDQAESLVGGITGKNAADAAKKAGDLQYQAAMDANALNREIFQTNRADLAPRLAIQNNALAQLANFNPAQIQSDPGYQFQLGQGTQAVERSAAARGLLGSGATIKSLDRFGQGLASQFAGQRFNQLAQLAGVSTDAAGMNQQNAQNYAANASNNITGAANARASGYLSAANAQQQGAGNLLNTGILGASLLFSDRRLKRDIEHIGTHSSGLNLYAFTYVWGEKAQGVMADEAMKVYPDAVHEGPGGYLMVDYGSLI